jgi:hypothetical protein
MERIRLSVDIVYLGLYHTRITDDASNARRGTFANTRLTNYARTSFGRCHALRA